jgi:hypothetical protein
MTIDLPWSEFVTASTRAGMRQARAIKLNRVGSDHGSVSDRNIRERFADSLMGEIGEMATAIALQLPHTRGGPKVEEGDIGHGIEVRATHHKNGHLLVFEKDGNEKPFVLAIPDFQQSGISVSMEGWMYGKDAKQKQYWRDSDVGCYWVPQSDLNPIDNLIQKIDTHA